MQKVSKGRKIPIGVTSLGQVGFRLVFEHTVVYVDPYLSDRVAEIEGDDLRRLVPPPMKPEEARDADFVLITHSHLDHCDPATILPIYHASARAIFIGPNEVGEYLQELGMDKRRITSAGENWIRMGDHLRVKPVPAAHPELERDGQNFPKCVGYVLENHGRKIYHAGDTSPHEVLISELKRLSPIDVAFLPVNEKNFYRERRGIIGNMSVREAFQMAEDIGVKTLVPMHWDLFAPNSVFPEEIELLYNKLRPPFHLSINPAQI